MIIGVAAGIIFNRMWWSFWSDLVVNLVRSGDEVSSELEIALVCVRDFVVRFGDGFGVVQEWVFAWFIRDSGTEPTAVRSPTTQPTTVQTIRNWINHSYRRGVDSADADAIWRRPWCCHSWARPEVTTDHTCRPGCAFWGCRHRITRAYESPAIAFLKGAWGWILQFSFKIFPKSILIKNRVTGGLQSPSCGVCFWWSPIDLRGSRSILSESIFVVQNSVIFSIKSSYVNPGTLRKSSGDLREHFRKRWF